MNNTSLLDAQRSAGGVCPDDQSESTSTLRFCFPPVLHFGDPATECKAVRDDAVVFDVSDRTQIEATGDDRQKFLHNFCTNDINRLQPGEGCEAFVTNIKGRILGHVFIFADEESLWIETIPGVEESLVAHLDRYIITDDVQLHSRTAENGELFVAGPQAIAKLQTLGIDVGSLVPFGHIAASLNDNPLSVRRTDLLGCPGYLLSASREQLADVWNHLRDNGFLPAGAEAFQVLRIEAGFPLYGLDLSEENLAQEAARTKQAISFTKGCYLGQEPIARLDALGHVNRELRGLRLESGSAPLPGTSVIASDDDKEIGTITSSAVSAHDNRSVALAFLRSSFAKPGTSVRVKSSEADVSATVFWVD